ncbi:MAG: IclR family transcriptional regulator [Candidimonas sp.]|nr:MAG: IclR family transcriptional regulator [Candidimonas sp.]
MPNEKGRYLRVPAVLGQLARAQHPQTLAQLAYRLELPKTTLMRILATLVTSRLVVRVPGERGYVLGPATTQLALEVLHTSYFSRAARSILAGLVQATGETCNLTALEGDSMRYLERVETSYLLRLKLDVGTRVPLHCTATGKLALALMDDTQRHHTLDRLTLDRHTGRTITDRTRLERELASIAQHAVGVDQEEFVRGMVAVSVPVLNTAGRMLAAIACHGPTARISMAHLMGAVPKMRDAAQAMAKVLDGESQPSKASA